MSRDARCLKSLHTVTAASIAVALLVSVAVAGASHDPSKPNVVFILADDLGWSDTTLFGTTSFYKTPNIERLAARGMTFTRAYAASPLCSPTRASVLTGLSPARTGITAPVCHTPKVTLKATVPTSGAPNRKATLPNSVTRLSTDYYTLAEMFQDNGYVTGHFGKWHLGPEPYSPLEHGFDVDVPHHPGPGPAGSYVAPWKFKDFDHDPGVPDQHIEDRMAQEAVAFLKKHKDGPFFLNYWMFSVHAPFDAKQALIENYRKEVDPTRSATQPDLRGHDRKHGRCRGHAVGRPGSVGSRGQHHHHFRVGQRRQHVQRSGRHDADQQRAAARWQGDDVRRGRARTGDCRLSGTRHKPGSRSDEVIQSCDFYPTLLELLDVPPQPGQTFDGVSIVPALQGQSLDRDAIFTYFPHNPGVPDWLPPAVSVHCGDWKLIRIFYGGEDGQHRWKLFNLRDDIGEQQDLAQEYPERVRELDVKIETFLKDTQAVVPLPNTKFDPAKYRPELEGKATLKGGSQKAAKPAQTKPVAGWQPGGTCRLAVEDGSLVVQSTGGDPFFSSPLPKAVSQKSLMLRFTMTSESSGSGQVFWHEQGVTPAFFRDRSVGFDAIHDGVSHEYVIEIAPGNPVLAVRIDPSRGPGKMQLSNIRLSDDAGNVLHQWKF